MLFRSSLATPGASTAATLTSLSPASATLGSPSITLTVNGSGFGNDSTVLWNGVIRATTFVNSSQLTATISAADLAVSGTAQVSVGGYGTVSSTIPFVVSGPAVTLSATMLTFGLQPVATASVAQTVTVGNSGTLPLAGLSIGLTGSDAGSFFANSTCGSSLAPVGSCTVSVVFNPATTGSKQAVLQITDNAINSPQTAP